jgi:replication factor C subunit 1
MDEYSLTKDDWDALIELRMEDDDILKKIPASVKSSFTRTYNKTAHHTPYAQTTAPTKKGRSTAAAVAVDFEEALDVEDNASEDEAAQSGDEGVDKMIKAKPVATKRKADTSTAAKGKRTKK